MSGGWRTEFTSHGRRQLRGIEQRHAKRILDELAQLQRAMDAGCLDGLDVLPLRMNRPSISRANANVNARREGEFRLDVYPFRVVYTPIPSSKVIMVETVGDRKDVYRDRGGK